MTIALIAAMGANRTIGKQGNLPWHLPADLRFFKQMTRSHTVIMGRKTFDSLGKPLPKRRNIVITRNLNWGFPGVERAGSLEEALDLARDDGEVFVVGGGEIYRLALPLADRIYLTVIDQDFEGDAFFPEVDAGDWQITERRDCGPDQENPYRFSFLTYERVQPAIR